MPHCLSESIDLDTIESIQMSLGDKGDQHQASPGLHGEKVDRHSMGRFGTANGLVFDSTLMQGLYEHLQLC